MAGVIDHPRARGGGTATGAIGPARWARAVAVLLVAAMGAAVPAQPALAAESNCGDVSPATAPTSHADGRYRPIVLVHGFIGGPGMWSKPVLYSSNSPSRTLDDKSIVEALAGLPGAAVYTVDYLINR